MHSLVRRVFHRLHDLDPVAEELKLQSAVEKMEIVPIAQNAASQADSHDSDSQDTHPNEEGSTQVLESLTKSETFATQMDERSECQYFC